MKPPTTSSSLARTYIQGRPLQFLFLATVLVSTLLLSSIYIIGDGQPVSDLKLFVPIVQSVKNLFQKKDIPVVLLWTTYFGNADWHLQGKACAFQCNVTSDRKYLEEADAVVFHLRDLVAADLPTFRGHAKWVLFNMEAPPNTPRKLVAVLDHKVNWTATYRKDSEIYSPYGIVLKRKYLLNETGGSSRQKKHLVCWIVSNCNTDSKREEYVQLLQKHIPVHIYGKCGKANCPTSKSRECYHHIANECKFYLAFENSICKDYITEKVFQALRTDMVPVVMGGANNEESLPPHSYIDALDFDGPKELADFLLSLDRDDRTFKLYHQWKTSYEIKNVDYEWVCTLCIKLRGYYFQSPKSRAEQDLVDWWFDSAKCHSWSDHYKY